MIDISDLALRITDYNGNSDIFPKSQVFETYEDGTCLVPKWLLEQKSVIYSKKKKYLIDTEKRKAFISLKNLKPFYEVEIETHVPEIIEIKQSSPDETLCK